MWLQVLRYTFLILTLLLAGLWVDSYWHKKAVLLRLNDSALGIVEDDGDLVVVYKFGGPFKKRFADTGIYLDDFIGRRSDKGPQSTDAFRFLGMYVREFRANRENTIGIPIWMLFTPLMLATCWLWYRPIRNRLRRKNDAGFPVEVITNEPPISPSSSLTQ